MNKLKNKNTLDSFDLFAAPMPQFNIDGLQKISTCVGFAFSALIFVIMVGFSASRFILLVKADRPDMQTYTIGNGLNITEPVDLAHFGFKMAFNVEKIKSDYLSERVDDNLNIVEWSVEYQEQTKDGNVTVTNIGFHKCTAEDYSNFN